MAVAISRMSRKKKLLLELYKPRPSSLVIRKELNRGAYGVVLDGTFKGRPVAIKKTHKTVMDAVTDEEVERLIRDFRKETDILTSIRHPHVVQALGAFYDPETLEPILVMEKMAKNLREYLEENKGLKELKQIHICLQIARGVQVLHQLTPPLAHRDLNDKNILLADDGTVKIGDFGQSKYKDLEDVYFGTEVPGAFLFMAPETFKPSGSEKAHYTESVDIFSLGVLALEIATQSRPTRSFHGFGILPEVKRRESDLEKLSNGHPLKPLVLECLEDNYKKRPVITQIVNNLEILIVEDYMGNTELLVRLDEAEKDRIKSRNDNTELSGEVTKLRGNVDVEKEKCEDMRKQLQYVSDEMNRIKRYSKHLEQSVDSFEYILMDKEHQNLKLKRQIADLQGDLESRQITVAQKEVQIVQRDEVIMQLRTQAYEMMEEIDKLEKRNILLEANINVIRHIVKSDVAEVESWKKTVSSQPSRDKSPPKKVLSRAHPQNSPVSSSSPAVHRMQDASPRQNCASDTKSLETTPLLQASTGTTEFNNSQGTKNPENTTPSQTQWPMPSNTSGSSQTSTNTCAGVRNSESQQVGQLGMFSGYNNQSSAGIQGCTTRDRIKPAKDYSQSRSLSTGGLVRCDRCNGEFKNKVAYTQHTLQSPCGNRHDSTRRRLFTLTENDPPS